MIPQIQYNQLRNSIQEYLDSAFLSRLKEKMTQKRELRKAIEAFYESFYGLDEVNRNIRSIHPELRRGSQ